MIQLLSGLGAMGMAGAVLLFLAVVLVVFGVGGMLAEQEFFQRRLAPSRETAVVPRGPKQQRSILLEDGLLKQFDALVTPKNQAELSAIRKRLLQAGYRF